MLYEVITDEGPVRIPAGQKKMLPGISYRDLPEQVGLGNERRQILRRFLFRFLPHYCP